MEGVRKPRRYTAYREVWLVQDRSKRNNRRERLALREKVKEENHLRDIRGVEGRYWNENVFAPPNGLREEAGKLKLRFRAGDLYYQKEERDASVVGRRRPWSTYVPVWHNNRE